MNAFARGLIVMAKGYPPDLGGVQTYSFELARELRRRQFRCLVITSRPGLRGVTREDGICVVNVGVTRQLGVAWRMFWVLRRVLFSGRRTRWDAGWATSWRVGTLFALMRLPFLLTVHGREVRDDRAGVRAWLMRRVLGSALAIVAISQYSFDNFVDPRYKNKAYWAWNGASAWAREIGVQRMRVAASPAQPVRILFAARMVASKNILGAIRGFDAFLRRGGAGELWLAGDGVEREAAEAAVVESGCGRFVRFLGHLRGRELIDAYRDADIFLHPHVGIETFCLAIADAMAAGLPVIAGSDGAPKEYLVNGRGVVVNGRDDEAIASALLYLQTTPEARSMIGEAAARFASINFTWHQHVARACALLNDDGWPK